MESKRWLLILVKFVFTNLLLITAQEDLRVCLPDFGCLQGTSMPGIRTEKFEAFLGIPYAKSPIGALRLQNPEPVAAWHNKTLDATKPKSHCLQKNYFMTGWPVSGDEDCLYLNLYRPLPNGQNPLPVIFYIHGGCFISGSIHPAILGPEHFMDTGDVIIVTVAYRLGPFGFLASGDEVMPGNFGLKDQNLALQWVNKHVAAFGGDPKRITIAGHSAGGSSVDFHILYELSRGLFSRAISMSGSALAPYVSVEPEPLKVATKLAQAAGIANAIQLSTKDLLKSMQNLDPLELLNAGDVFKSWFMTPVVNFRPNIENANWKNAFITEDPEKRVKMGNFQHVPWMTGFVPSEGEGAILTLDILEDPNLRNEFNQNFDEMLEKIMQFTSDKIVQLDANEMQMVIQEYFQGTHELNDQTALGFRQIVGDLAFHYPFYKSVKNYLNDVEPVHIMKFNYSGPYSFTMFCQKCSRKSYGVSHMDDMMFLFRQPFLFPKSYEHDSTEAAVVQALVGSYVEYAKNGFSMDSSHYKRCQKSVFSNNPNGICEYVSFSNEDHSYKMTTDAKFNLKRMQFWEGIMGDAKDN